MRPVSVTLPEKGPYSEFFWSVFFSIRTKKLRIRTLSTQHQVIMFGNRSYIHHKKDFRSQLLFAAIQKTLAKYSTEKT